MSVRPAAGSRHGTPAPAPQASAGGRRAQSPAAPQPGAAIVAASSGLAMVLLMLILIGDGLTAGRVSSEDLAARTAQCASEYLAIAGPSDARLAREESSYAADERGNLAAARSDLLQEVATEQAFDSQLAKIKFPAMAAAIAHALIQANEDRSGFTGQQAQSRSLGQLRSLDGQRMEGDAAVEIQVGLIRTALRLPPGPRS